MGNETSNLHDHQIATFFRAEDWIRLSFRLNYQLWKHKYTHELAEVYRLGDIPNSKDMKIYQFRSKHEEIVKIYFIGESKGDLFCGGSRQIVLLVEHIPLRLADVDELTQSEGLTILVSALRGFRSIESEYGTVWPRDDLIGFNIQGRTKVWLSKHFQENTRDQEHTNFYFDTSVAQSRRIKHLYDIIERKTIGYLLPYEWKLNLLDKNADYEKILTLVEKYAKTNKVSLKDYIQRDGIGYSRLSKVTNTQPNSQSRKQAESALKRVSSSEQLRNDSQHEINSYEQRKNMNQTCFTYPSHHYQEHISHDTTMSKTTIPTTFTVYSKPRINFVRPRGQTISSFPVQSCKFAEKSGKTDCLEGDVPNKRKPTIIDTIQLEYTPEHERPVIRQATKQIKPTVTIVEHRNEQEKIEEQQSKIVTQQSPQLVKQSSKEQKMEFIGDIITAEVRKIDQEENKTAPKKKHKIAIRKIVSTEAIQQNVDTDKQSQNNVVLESKANPIAEEVEDYLDINFMEKSLSKKFCSPTPAESIIPIAVEHHEDDMFNIAKLQQGLVKFQQSQQSQRKMRQSQSSSQGQSVVRSIKPQSKQAEEKKQSVAVRPFTVSNVILEQYPHSQQERLFQVNLMRGASTQLHFDQQIQKPRANTNYSSSSYRNNFRSRDRYPSNMDKTYDNLGKYPKTRDIEERYRIYVKDKKSKGQLGSFYESEYKKGSQVSQGGQQRKVSYEQLMSTLKI